MNAKAIKRNGAAMPKCYLKNCKICRINKALFLLQPLFSSVTDASSRANKLQKQRTREKRAFRCYFIFQTFICPAVCMYIVYE